MLFFIPFCLVLLGMSSLPVWRDEHILFTHEQSNKQLYGVGGESGLLSLSTNPWILTHTIAAYFVAVLCFDLIIVRSIPPLFFAFISYQWIGLNSHCNNCLIYFAVILVFTNVISALVSMTIGAFRFS